MDWPTSKYAAILADPPWHFLTWSEKGGSKSAKVHYPVMSIDDIAALPIKDLAADDCVLFMWVIQGMLPDALTVIKSWGFQYKTIAFVWAKTTAAGKYPIGTGYWTRPNAEICLLATRGKPKRVARGVRQLIIAKRREHSRKPDEQYERITQLVNGPYLEVFARQPWPQWDAWGNQTNKFDVEAPSSQLRMAV